MKLLILINLFLLFGITTNEEGALTKTFHKTIDIDGVESITAAYDQEVEILPWEGSLIMVEVSVVMHNASPAVFSYFEKSGRYETLTSLEGEKMILSPKKKKQQSVMVKGVKKETFEEVSIKIMVPSEFKKVGEKEWVRESTF